VAHEHLGPGKAHDEKDQEGDEEGGSRSHRELAVIEAHFVRARVVHLAICRRRRWRARRRERQRVHNRKCGGGGGGGGGDGARKRGKRVHNQKLGVGGGVGERADLG